jgi:hypothetical protein
VAASCEYGDGPSGSGATELVSWLISFTTQQGKRRIFGSKTDEVTGEWRKLHNEELIICTHFQISLGRSSQGE